MKKIWVIEQGSYSDYHVVGVFSTKENAELMCNKINESKPYDDASIAEWIFDPGIDEMNAGLKQYYIIMDYYGNTERVEIQDDFDSTCLSDTLTVWERTKTSWGDTESDTIQGIVWADDDKHAVKIANEHRTRAIAENRMHTKKEINNG